MTCERFTRRWTGIILHAIQTSKSLKWTHCRHRTLPRHTPCSKVPAATAPQLRWTRIRAGLGGPWTRQRARARAWTTVIRRRRSMNTRRILGIRGWCGVNLGRVGGRLSWVPVPRKTETTAMSLGVLRGTIRRIIMIMVRAVLRRMR